MIIYKVTNTINGKCYIGQTKHTLSTRQSQHLYESKSDTSFVIYKAIRKYGWHNFTWQVLDNTCQTREELNEMEFHYIKQYQTHWSKGKGYNMTWGYNGIYEITKATRKKMSKSKTGYNNPWYGKKRPDISELHKGDNNAMRNPDIRKKFCHKWVLIDKNGKEYKVDDLSSFCNEYNLIIHNMYCLARSGGKSRTGWRIYKDD